jgi:hypothetical protein
MSAEGLIRELELLVSRLEEFIDKALASHREFCEKIKTREYTVEKCTSGLAWALIPIVREYIARNIYTRIATLTAKYKITIPELTERTEKTLVKLRKTAKPQ